MFPLVSTILTLSMDIMVISAEIVSLFFKYYLTKTFEMITYPRFRMVNNMK